MWMMMCNRLILGVGMLASSLLVLSCEEPAEDLATVTPAEALEARIRQLEDQLAAKDETVEEVRRELQSLEERVPEPRTVEAGDTHWELAESYLIEEEGLVPQQAERELAKSALLDPVLEGQEVWNYYDDGIFGSFVVQGTAPLSPGALVEANRREQERIRAEKERLESRVAEVETELATERARLGDTVERLERQLSASSTEVDALRSYIDDVLDHQEALRSRVISLTERLHSVYYLAGTDAELRAEGKIERPFLQGARLGELDSADFERHLDLREAKEFRLTADELGVASIENVDVLPRQWERGRDYRVDISSGGEIATIQLVDEERFRLRTLVIVVNS